MIVVALLILLASDVRGDDCLRGVGDSVSGPQDPRQRDRIGVGKLLWHQGYRPAQDERGGSRNRVTDRQMAIADLRQGLICDVPATGNY